MLGVLEANAALNRQRDQLQADLLKAQQLAQENQKKAAQEAELKRLAENQLAAAEAAKKNETNPIQAPEIQEQVQAKLTETEKLLKDCQTQLAQEIENRKKVESQLLEANQLLQELQTRAIREAANQEQIEAKLAEAEQQTKEQKDKTGQETKSRELVEAQLFEVKQLLQEAQTKAIDEAKNREQIEAKLAEVEESAKEQQLRIAQAILAKINAEKLAAQAKQLLTEQQEKADQEIKNREAIETQLNEAQLSAKKNEEEILQIKESKKQLEANLRAKEWIVKEFQKIAKLVGEAKIEAEKRLSKEIDRLLKEAEEKAVEAARNRSKLSAKLAATTWLVKEFQRIAGLEGDTKIEAEKQLSEKLGRSLKESEEKALQEIENRKQIEAKLAETESLLKEAQKMPVDSKVARTTLEEKLSKTQALIQSTYDILLTTYSEVYPKVHQGLRQAERDSKSSEGERKYPLPDTINNSLISVGGLATKILTIKNNLANHLPDLNTENLGSKPSRFSLEKQLSENQDVIQSTYNILSEIDLEIYSVVRKHLLQAEQDSKSPEGKRKYPLPDTINNSLISASKLEKQMLTLVITLENCLSSLNAENLNQVNTLFNKSYEETKVILTVKSNLKQLIEVSDTLAKLQNQVIAKNDLLKQANTMLAGLKNRSKQNINTEVCEQIKNDIESINQYNNTLRETFETANALKQVLSDNIKFLVNRSTGNFTQSLIQSASKSLDTYEGEHPKAFESLRTLHDSYVRLKSDFAQMLEKKKIVLN